MIPPGLSWHSAMQFIKVQARTPIGGAPQAPKESNPHSGRVGAGPPNRWLMPMKLETALQDLPGGGVRPATPVPIRTPPRPPVLSPGATAWRNASPALGAHVTPRVCMTGKYSRIQLYAHAARVATIYFVASDIARRQLGTSHSGQAVEEHVASPGHEQDARAVSDDYPGGARDLAPARTQDGARQAGARPQRAGVARRGAGRPGE